MTHRYIISMLLGLVFLTAGAAGSPREAIETLREQMPEEGAVTATFREERYFPFRKEPVVLEGELAYAPRLGLSLNYLHPEERRVVINGRQFAVYGKDEPEQVRQVPQRFAVMEPLLSLNLEQLEADYDLSLSGETEWVMKLRSRREDVSRPRRTVSAPSETIEVRGDASAIHHIEIVRPGSIRVLITMAGTEQVETADAIPKRFFNP